MTSRRVNPAIYAGLAGAAAWAEPTVASALTVFGQEIPTSNPGVAFVTGCVVGALVASGTTIALSRVSLARDEAASAAPAAADAGSDAAAGQGGADAPAHEAYGKHGPSRARGAYGSHARRQAASATGSWDRTGDIRVQRPVPEVDVSGGASPAASDDYADVAEAYVRRRTLSERMAARAKGVASVLSERLGASRMEGLPVIERADGTVGDVGTAWWDDAFGEEKVEGAERRTAGFAGVNDQLAGNSAALFTAQTAAEAQAAYEALRRQATESGQSWPSAAGVASQHASASQGSQQQVDPSQGASRPVRASEPAWVQGVPVVGSSVGTVAAPAPRVRSSIVSRVAGLGGEGFACPGYTGTASAFAARPGEPATPAQAQAPAEAHAADAGRWSDEQQDLWAVALRALDERFQEQVAMGPDAETPAFGGAVDFDDGIGDATTLDEPEGLEASTAFMAFKPQAGHPEVRDRESYVNLLVDQELSRSKSPSVRRGFHDYLRLIDGGTSPLASRRHQREESSGKGAPARHFAVQA